MNKPLPPAYDFDDFDPTDSNAGAEAAENYNRALKRITEFVTRARELRNGSPNAFYRHVDTFIGVDWGAHVEPPSDSPQGRDWTEPKPDDPNWIMPELGYY